MAAVTNAQTIQAPPGAPDTAHLTGTEGLVLAAIVVAAVLGAGGIIAWARSTETTKPDEPGGSLVRSWIAVGCSRSARSPSPSATRRRAARWSGR